MKKKITKPEQISNDKIDQPHKSRKVKVSHKFVNALSIVSILGFAGIVSQSLFDFNIGLYVESLLMFVIGLGLILEAKFDKIKSISKKGLNSGNFSHLTTFVIGFIALLSGVLSFPPIRVEIPAFIAIKGIISLIAIIVIIIQTWIVD